MGKVKVHREKPSIDMTPMVDLAFLLVTFFMLTTNFRTQEPVTVKIPASVSELKIPVRDIMTITIGKEGKVFFDLSGQPARKRLLQGIANKYNVSFTPEEIETFSLMSSFGVPVGALKQLLNLESDERSEVEQPGIPVDSTNNQLKQWILLSRLANPKARIAIKGDKDVAYPVVEEVINTVQDAGVNRFNLVTSLKKGPSSSQ